jgi:hypothetical protein
MNMEAYLNRLHKLAEKQQRRIDLQKKPKLKD